MLLNHERQFSRFVGIDLTGIHVRRAVSDADLQVVAELRRAGFSRVNPNGSGHIAWVDELDRTPGGFSLIGYSEEGQPVATMRVQDGRKSTLELTRFVDLSGLLQPDDWPAVQFARLSVIKAPQATAVMVGLLKAAWRWTFSESIRSIVIGSPPWARPLHSSLLFTSLGPRGEFAHEFAGGAHHVTMKLPVLDAEAIWRSAGHPLCRQLFDTDHPQLEIRL